MFYTSYNTEGSTTRTLTSPSTPASNAQMAFEFVANAARTCDADGRPAPRRGGPLSRASCCETQCARHRPTRRGGHATTDHARKRRRRQAGRSKRARGHWEGDADERLLHRRSSVPVRPLVAAHASISSRSTRQRAAHGMCTGLDSLMALAQCAQECASCPLRNTLATLRHRRRGTLASPAFTATLASATAIATRSTATVTAAFA